MKAYFTEWRTLTSVSCRSQFNLRC